MNIAKQKHTKSPARQDVLERLLWFRYHCKISDTMHHSTFSECLITFPCTLNLAWSKETQDKLQCKFVTSNVRAVRLDLIIFSRSC